MGLHGVDGDLTQFKLRERGFERARSIAFARPVSSLPRDGCQIAASH